MEKVLAIFEKTIYLSFEPNDPHLLHVGFGVVSSPVRVDVLLREAAVNYAVKAQHGVEAKLLGQPLVEVDTSPAKVMELLTKNKSAIYVVEEDLKARGLSQADLIESVQVIPEAETAKLLEEHDATFVW